MNGNTALMHAAKIGLAEVVSLILTQLSAVHRVICLGTNKLTKRFQHLLINIELLQGRKIEVG